jgi:hypothetical protein
MDTFRDGAPVQDPFTQCELTCGNRRLVTFVQPSKAKKGAQVKLKGRTGVWTITAVYVTTWAAWVVRAEAA